MYETTKFIGFILFFYKKKIYKLKKKMISILWPGACV